MPRLKKGQVPHGSIEWRNGVATLRLHIGGKHPRFWLGEGLSPEEARRRGDILAERVRHEGYEPDPDRKRRARQLPTVRAHFDAWTSGKLYDEHGEVNGLKPKKSADVDAWRAAKYIYPVIGDMSVKDVTEEDIDHVLARATTSGTKMKVYALLGRGVDLAIMPGRLRKDSPVTRYHRPSKARPKLFTYLFPSEFLALLRCVDIPLGRRVFYAMAVYTGLRKSSLYALRWKHVDKKNRTLLSKVSKNGVPQYFEIWPGLVWVLDKWHEYLGKPGDEEPVVQKLKLERGKGGEAETLRKDLRAACVDRAILFEKSPEIEPLRFHDARASFVTWAVRAGKPHGWIADRTGHLTPEMIARYTRGARTLEDLEIEPFPELEGTIPEFAPPLATSAASSCGSGA